jgi:hypothetical protein
MLKKKIDGKKIEEDGRLGADDDCEARTKAVYNLSRTIYLFYNFMIRRTFLSADK